ncbi:MAG: hypothetical protein HQL94_06230, partial [Magnetococcales bacterium]|nr:hypothetical protein [Magnetococcales bacterium]
MNTSAITSLLTDQLTAFIEYMAAGDGPAMAAAQKAIATALSQQGISLEQAETIGQQLLVNFLTGLERGEFSEQMIQELVAGVVLTVESIYANDIDAAQSLDVALASGVGVNNHLIQAGGDEEQFTAFQAGIQEALQNKQGIKAAVKSAQQQQESVHSIVVDQVVPVDTPDGLAMGLALGMKYAEKALQALVVGMPEEQAAAFLRMFQESIAQGMDLRAAFALSSQYASQYAQDTANRQVALSPEARLAAALASGKDMASALQDAGMQHSNDNGSSLQAFTAALAAGVTPVQAALVVQQTQTAITQLQTQMVVPLSSADRLAMALASGVQIQNALDKVSSNGEGANVFLATLSQALEQGTSMSQAMNTAQSVSTTSATLAQNASVPVSPADQLMVALASGNNAATLLAEVSKSNPEGSAAFLQTFAQALSQGSNPGVAMSSAKEISTALTTLTTASVVSVKSDPQIMPSVTNQSEQVAKVAETPVMNASLSPPVTTTPPTEPAAVVASKTPETSTPPVQAAAPSISEIPVAVLPQIPPVVPVVASLLPVVTPVVVAPLEPVIPKTNIVPEVAPTIITGSIVAGPVITSNDLKVIALKANAVTVLGEGLVGTNGKFTINVGNYTGVVITKVVNSGTGPDYLDEATGISKDLNAELFSIGVINDSSKTINLNINVLTTVAYHKIMGIAGDVAPDNEIVNNINTSVAETFGLTNLHTVEVITVNGETSYNSTDGINEGEIYGIILAALSGADLNNDGNTQTTIDELVEGITITENKVALDPVSQEKIITGAETANVDTTDDALDYLITIAPDVYKSNDPPVVFAGGMLAYTEGSLATAIDNTITVNDPDDTHISMATVVISSGYTSGDVLSISAQNGITGSYTSGTLTLTGSATLANYQAALRTVSFNSTSNDPTYLSTSRTITWEVTDGNSDDDWAQTSVGVTSSITITPTSDAPVATAGGVLAYTEGDVATVVDDTITINDVDDTLISGATVVISSGYTSGDVLSITTQNGITGSYNAGTLTLTGNATLANYQTAL